MHVKVKFPVNLAARKAGSKKFQEKTLGFEREFEIAELADEEFPRALDIRWQRMGRSRVERFEYRSHEGALYRLIGRKLEFQDDLINDIESSEGPVSMKQVVCPGMRHDRLGSTQRPGGRAFDEYRAASHEARQAFLAENGTDGEVLSLQGNYELFVGEDSKLTSAEAELSDRLQAFKVFRGHVWARCPEPMLLVDIRLGTIRILDRPVGEGGSIHGSRKTPGSVKYEFAMRIADWKEVVELAAMIYRDQFGSDDPLPRLEVYAPIGEEFLREADPRGEAVEFLIAMAEMFEMNEEVRRFTHVVEPPSFDEFEDFLSRMVEELDEFDADAGVAKAARTVLDRIEGRPMTMTGFARPEPVIGPAP